MSARANMLVVLAWCAGSVSALAQSGDVQDGESPERETPVREARSARAIDALDVWRDRLAAMAPEDAEGYLLLAEEMLDAGNDARVRRLATELLVHALTQGSGSGDTSTASSAALALADIAPDPQSRRALRALARTLEPRLAPATWNAPRQAANAGSTDYQIAVAIGNTRSGLGQYVRQSLRKPEISTRADAASPLLEQIGLAGGRDWIESKSRNWPCPECSNTLIVRRGNERRLCGTCKGMPGPQLSAQEMVASLRAELFLLRGDEGEWSRQLLIDGGEPLQMLDVSSVSRLFNVDTRKPYFRAGKWTTFADGSDPAPVAPEPTVTPPAPSEVAPTDAAPTQPAPQQPVQPAPTQPAPAPGLPIPIPGMPMPVPTQPVPQPTNPSEDPLPGEVPINIPALPPMNPQPSPSPNPQPAPGPK